MTDMLAPMEELVFESVAFGPPVLAALAIGLAAMSATYLWGLRWQHRRRRLRYLLLALRLGAIACLIAALLHPVLERSVTDRDRPVLAVVLDDSASMAQPHEADRSRLDAARRMLDERLTPALHDRFELRRYNIVGEPLDALPADATHPTTPLTETLASLADRSDRGRLAGIVLLSDGAEATWTPPLEAIDQVRVPVYVIDLFDPVADEQPADLSIASVVANRRALVGNTVRVQVDVIADQAAGPFGLPLTVRHGEQIVATRTIHWPEGERSRRGWIEFTPTRPGQFHYTVQIGAAAGERKLDDNRSTFGLDVRAEPLTVIYIDGVLRWEGKFIREALADDPDVNVVSSVRTARPGADAGSRGLLLPEQLQNVDVVILGDVEASYFSEPEINALQSWVRESGGGLLLTGGYRSFGPAGFGRSRLREILPIHFSAADHPQVEQPFRLKLTPLGRGHPIFHLRGDRVRDAGFYQSLPELLGSSRIAAVKPGAEVLAINPTVGEADGGLPVMVVQPVGEGRSMVFAVDTTWRWRMVVGGFTGDRRFYPRFWGQLVRYLAGAPTEEPPRLALTVERQRYRAGESIVFRAALREADEAAALKLEARAVDERGRARRIALTELDGGHYRGQLDAVPAGRLDLFVAAEPVDEASGVRPASAQQRVDVAGDGLEQRHAGPDRTHLRRLARRSGGAVIDPGAVERWAADLPAPVIEAERLQRAELWRHPALAGAFLALLCLEWLLRRRSRLA